MMLYASYISKQKEKRKLTDQRGTVGKLQDSGDTLSELLLERGTGEILAKLLTGTAVQRLAHRASSSSQVDWSKWEMTKARQSALTLAPTQIYNLQSILRVTTQTL